MHDSKSRLAKGGLIFGFLALAVAAVFAHSNPAHTYEVSIYSRTPLVFWVGAGIAVLLAIGVAVYTRGVIRWLALTLCGTVTLTIAALPRIRGYYYFGHGDALTHLGWTKEIKSAAMDPIELLYPGIHTVAVILSSATGLSVRQTLLLTVLAFILSFLVFLPLCARAIDSQRQTFVFAAIAACLLLPINGISLFAQPHPATQAILFFPFPLFLAIKYLTSDNKNLPFGKTPYSILLALSSLAILLVHPQQTANVILVFGAIVGVQWLYSLFRSNHPIVNRHRSLFGQTAFLGVLLVVWMSTHQRASGSAAYLVRQLLFASNTAAKDISQQAGGLAQVGGSLEMMFLKLFLVSVIFCGITGLTLLSGLGDYLNVSRTNQFSKYAIIGLIPLFGLFGAYLATSTGKFHFRQLGFIMVLVTLFGSIGLSHFVDTLKQWSPNQAPIKIAVIVIVAMMFALSCATLFHSPYTFQSSEQVTKGQMVGYKTAFEHRGEPPVIGLRAPGTRFADALYGVRENHPRQYLGDSLYADTPATGDNFTSQYIYNYYNSSRYLPITSTARQRELRVYNGFRFSRSGFRSLNTHPGVARVQSGGGIQVYLIDKSRQ